MFQATGLGSYRQRPSIMHAYGGAKSGMARTAVHCKRGLDPACCRKSLRKLASHKRASLVIGAATVMDSLMYGAGHCWNGMVNMHLRQLSLDECLGDNQFQFLGS